jgi:hypothetical protein
MLVRTRARLTTEIKPKLSSCHYRHYTEHLLTCSGTHYLRVIGTRKQLLLATRAATAVTLCSPLKTATTFRHEYARLESRCRPGTPFGCARKGTAATGDTPARYCARVGNREKASAGTLCARELLSRNELKHAWISRTGTWTGASQDPRGRSSRELLISRCRRTTEEKSGQAQLQIEADEGSTDQTRVGELGVARNQRPAVIDRS